MVGKPPHQPAGKARTDEEHRAEIKQKGLAYQAPSAREIADANLAQKARADHEKESETEEPFGGSRPGVPSRVRGAIDAREGRLEWEDEEKG